MALDALRRSLESSPRDIAVAVLKLCVDLGVKNNN
jgi:hypothetical protein